MKKISLLLLSLVLGITPVSYAQSDFVPSDTEGSGPTSVSDENVSKYLKNLGEYLGYDLEKAFTPVTPIMLSTTSAWAQMGDALLKTFFGAIPVNTYYEQFSSQSTFTDFNSQANATFKDYSSAEGSGGGVAVLKDFDQKDYQKDPVNQAILNILATADYDTCVNSDTCVNQGKVMYTVLQDILNASSNKGVLPGENSYYLYDNNIQFLSQLNVNTLIAPLLYNTDGDAAGNGLPAGNQQQQAQDFIRYATSEVLPIETMSAEDYSTLWSEAYKSPEGQSQSTVDAIKSAQKDLATYLLGLRVYAAQSSVAVSNLYQIMAKRMPQSQTSKSSTGTSSSVTSSQSANEFQAATWRLYDPSQSAKDQWVQQLNAASSGTIQKEIAVLLSEINYQLYLSRQQDERILLTDSLILLQALASNKPSAAPEKSNTSTTEADETSG